MTVYRRSQDYNYYFRDSDLSINYSDGTVIEDRLYKIISETKDKRVLSDELAKKIVDWPTEYHFSRSRHCLLKHLPFKKEDFILELGCGCGAITRFLGETGAVVDSVEGTHSRARIAGERCLDLPNVNVYVDNLLNYESDKKYDWVLLIGVLEYAPLFSSEKDAIQHYLSIVKKYLKSTGRFVLAIENKLGLKYFNGCSEDHVNEPFFGLENRYNENTPITFGKKELSSQLKSAGFSDINYYYPFPDYKLPSTIINDTALVNKISISDLIKDKKSTDYSGRTYRSFDETFVWPELEKNSLIGDLSNSFLVVASESNCFYEKDDTFAWHYNISRLSQYVTQTTFYKENSCIMVHKTTIDDRVSTIFPEKKFYIKNIKEEFIDGNSLQHIIESEWHKYGDFESIINLYAKWFKFIVNISDFDDIKSFDQATLPGSCIDLTPFNIKLNDNEFLSYDQEWDTSERISLQWLVFRGVYWSLNRFNSRRPMVVNILDILNKIISCSGISIERDFHNYDKAIIQEVNFISIVTGENIEIEMEIRKYPCNLDVYEKELEKSRYEIQRLSSVNELLNKENLEFKYSLDKYHRFFPIRCLRYLKRLFN
ncbi:class I SAM-dependent methyltransferase [Vibrio cholerae]|uniref:class I SAM-dependent methyltransferase n=1 Tax=Vibrio cholerae TaxID=666 RepID=UPI001C311711|nr:class I SAM-dependent methyltransferase [Vibrio cholerae]